MTKYLNGIFILILALGLLSCASYKGFPDRTINSDTELEDLKDYFLKEKVTTYDTILDEADRRRFRNQVINGRLAAIDIQFSLFQKNLHEDGLNLNIGSDAVILGLGAAGALATGGTSQVLSATSAAVTGLHGSINKNAFYEQTMPALFAQMIAQRKTVLVKIRTGLASNSSDYPLQQGFVDLEDYQYAGSIPGSIATIVEDAGVTSAEATANLKDIVIRSNLDNSARRLVADIELTKDSNGNNKYNPEEIKKIKDCWSSAGVPKDTQFIIFMNDPKFATQRVQVNECMNK